MRSKIILIVSFCLIAAVPAFSQLKVAADGKVGIALSSNTTPLSNLSIGAAGQSNARLFIRKIGLFSDNQYGIYSNMKSLVSNGWTLSIAGSTIGASLYSVGVKGEAIAENLSGNLLVAHTYGVYGSAGGARYGRNYGIYGSLLVNRGSGAGIYGTNDSIDFSISGRYAGFFQGQTKVNGNFYATTVNTTSDMRLKTNISDVEYGTISKLQNLRPVQFLWKQQDVAKNENNANESASAALSSDIDRERVHYGFIAQELQKLYPELVMEDEDGYLSINYVELIPLLVQAVQELSAEVNNLKGTTPNRVMAHMNNEADNVNAILYQNNPNPFTTDTRIGYSLPASTSSASLYIYNMNGAQIADYPITTFGEGFVIIKAGVMDAGMYLYSLIADGQVVDTKRMILTK